MEGELSHVQIHMLRFVSGHPGCTIQPMMRYAEGESGRLYGNSEIQAERDQLVLREFLEKIADPEQPHHFTHRTTAAGSEELEKVAAAN